MTKISIIVPVYNAEKYLARCLDSLICQDLKDIEIIVVDDCSMDSSRTIVQDYLMKGRNIRLIRNDTNSGAATSRKNGFKSACGEYVMFVDADDWMELDACSLFYHYAKQGDYDIVYSNIDRIDSKNKVVEKGMYYKNLFGLEGKVTDEKRKALALWDGATYWGRIYKRSWFEESGFRFMENGRFDEDDVEILLPMMAHRIGLIDKVLYHWFVNNDSVTRTRHSHYIERYDCAIYVLGEAKRLGLYEDYKEELDYSFIRSFILNSITAFYNLLEYESIVNEDLERLIEYVRKTNMDFMHNKYYRLLEKEETKMLAKALTSKEEFENVYYYEYREYYIDAKDKINCLREYIDANNLNVVLWGAGKKSRTFAKLYPNFMEFIVCIVDSNKSLAGVRIEGKYLIQSKERIDENIDLVIVMNHNHMANIASQLKEDIKILDMDYYLCYGINDITEGE